MATCSTPQKRSGQGTLVGQVELEKDLASEKKRCRPSSKDNSMEYVVDGLIKKHFASWSSFAVDLYTVNGATLRQRVEAICVVAMEKKNKKSELSRQDWLDLAEEYKGTLNAKAHGEFLASSNVVVVGKLVLPVV